MTMSVREALRRASAASAASAKQSNGMRIDPHCPCDKCVEIRRHFEAKAQERQRRVAEIVAPYRADIDKIMGEA